ncbi:MAG: sortase [Patescibacteria group bacterium]|nr:sortase [Patescibacteria group bacterium]
MKFGFHFFLETIANALIIGGILLLGITIWPTVSSEAWYWAKRVERGVKCKIYNLDCAKTPDSLFAPLANSPTPLKVTPISSEFAVVIEKIGVNAPVIKNVPAGSKDQYMAAMRRGVAHAKGTALPGEAGNTYLFAHSSLNFWELGKYATVFNLLRKLEKGDRVSVVLDNQRFVYEVSNKEIVSGFNTTPLLRETSEPTLTLQTCHPPGTTLNRLIVTAKLTGNSAL